MGGYQKITNNINKINKIKNISLSKQKYNILLVAKAMIMLDLISEFYDKV